MEYSWWYSRRPGRRWPPGRDDSSGAGCSRSTHLRRSETSARGRDDRNPRSVAQPARTLRPGSVNERRHRHEQETEHRVSASSLDHARRPDRKGPAERCPGRAQLSAHGGWMLLGVAAGAGISDLGESRAPLAEALVDVALRARIAAGRIPPSTGAPLTWWPWCTRGDMSPGGRRSSSGSTPQRRPP